MDIAICDDQKSDIAVLLQTLVHNHRISYYTSAEALLIDLEESKKHFDLYFLDIYMDGMDGITLARHIRALYEDALLCFISTSSDFYREAYDLYAFQYLIKPVTSEKLCELIQKAAQVLGRTKLQTIPVDIHGRIISVPYGDILFIYSQNHYLFYQCKNGVLYQSRGKLDALFEQLHPGTFCRCHQSYIVNLYNITELDGNEFICENYRVPISRRYAGCREQYRITLFENL